MDIELYYEEKGSGEPLLLLHGNGESCDYFVRQTEVFAKHFRVIAIDSRGHGKSPRGTAPFTIRQFADDLKEFMDGHGLRKAHILGFSDGANIAMCFAAKYPEMVNRLILNGGNLNPSGVKLTVQAWIEIGYRIAKLFSGKSPEAKQNAELLGLMTGQLNILPEELKRIPSETLVIAGTEDLIKRKHTEQIAGTIAKSRLCFIKGDHSIAQKNPDEYNKAVLDFLLG